MDEARAAKNTRILDILVRVLIRLVLPNNKRQEEKRTCDF